MNSGKGVLIFIIERVGRVERVERVYTVYTVNTARRVTCGGLGLRGSPWGCHLKRSTLRGALSRLPWVDGQDGWTGGTPLN